MGKYNWNRHKKARKVTLKREGLGVLGSIVDEVFYGLDPISGSILPIDASNTSERFIERVSVLSNDEQNITIELLKEDQRTTIIDHIIREPHHRIVMPFPLQIDRGDTLIINGRAHTFYHANGVQKFIENFEIFRDNFLFHVNINGFERSFYEPRVSQRYPA